MSTLTLDLTEINLNLTVMKKRILLLTFLLAALCLAVIAFTYKSDDTEKNPDLATAEVVRSESNDSEASSGPELPNFMFDLGPRYRAIKKSKLAAATSFDDFIGKEHQDRIVNYKTLSVYEMVDGVKTKWNLTSFSGEFTAAQREYLQDRGYNEDVLIWATYTEKWPETGIVEDSYWTPHLTVVPEKQAHYDMGKEALLEYLNVQSAEITSKIEGRLQPGRIHITIGAEGAVKKLKVKSTSGNEELDSEMLELLSNAPGKWIPAENTEGENVEQELVLFFGSMGC